MPKRRPGTDGCQGAKGSSQLGVGLVGGVQRGAGDAGSILFAFLAAVSFHGMQAPLAADAAPLGDNATLITTATTTAATSMMATTMVELQLDLRLNTNQVGIGQMGTTLAGDDEEQHQPQQQGQRQTTGDIWSETLDTATLTKGFSIPTYLPPFPEFIPADLPQRLTNATATRTDHGSKEEKRNESDLGNGKPISNEPQSRLHAYNSEQKELQLKREKQLAKERASGHQRQLSLPPLNASVQAGQHAYLPCQLHQHSNKPLSWVRLRDEHIIAVDHTTFINDARFASLLQQSTANTSIPIANLSTSASRFNPESGNGSSGLGWTLQIKYVKLEDAGWYECQLATEPKMSAKVQLFVITPRTELIGDQQRFVKAGSRVELHCIVRGTLEAPKYIFWYRGEEQVTSDAEAENENKPSSKTQSGWYTQIDRNIFGSTEHNRNTIGSLIIPLVRKTHSGNYTCEPENSAAVSMQLHVLSGEYSASAIMSTANGLHRHGHGYSSLHQWLIFLLVALNKT
ncbi:uncharacterized protein LOC6651382 [Drosophila willistoni]|uniref:uncharacterized protein LOC6651382 n=1 Tax=Drosophila willistoni TaxID=7260 RepID=UPI000C26C806|nr:uncharacterized protein LOC6651382 [Drosophila willistoni]XP_023036083.1 uncharacterized protein LOC6651382 [Drosophila willistoni]